MIVCIKINTRMRGALNADCNDARYIELLANPARNIFVCWLCDRLIEVTVIQWRNTAHQMLGEGVDLGAGKGRPVCRQGGAHFTQEAMSMQTRCTMLRWQALYLAGGFKTGCSNI